MFFKKKKEEPIDIDLIKKVNEKFTDTGNEDVTKLKTEVDKLKAHSETYKEMAKLRDDRIARLTEQMGELRSELAERDQKIKELEAKAVKAADLVEMVQPDKLMAAVKKQDLKGETIRSKLDSYHDLLDKVMEELKDMRHTIEVFRGVEHIAEMSKELKDDIQTVKKIEANIKKEADKVESILIRSQHSFVEMTEMRKYEDKVDTLSDNIRHAKEDMRNEFNALLNTHMALIRQELTKMHEVIYNIADRHQNLETWSSQWFDHLSKRG